MIVWWENSLMRLLKDGLVEQSISKRCQMSGYQCLSDTYNIIFVSKFVLKTECNSQWLYTVSRPVILWRRKPRPLREIEGHWTASQFKLCCTETEMIRKIWSLILDVVLDMYHVYHQRYRLPLSCSVTGKACKLRCNCIARILGEGSLPQKCKNKLNAKLPILHEQLLCKF